jgi:hypothetical protein
MKKLQRRYVFPDGERYPIVESDKQGMMLLATQEDVDKAERHDPYACVLAQCAIRSGAKRAFIAGTVAYLVMPHRGELCAFKFTVPPSTQKAIQEFDANGYMPAEGFILSPLSRHSTQDAKKVNNARRPSRSLKWKPKKDKSVPPPRTYRFLSGHVQTDE